MKTHEYNPESYGNEMVNTKIEERLITLTPDASLVYYNLKEHHVYSEEEWLGLNFLAPTEANWFNLEVKPFQTKKRSTRRLLGV